LVFPRRNQPAVFVPVELKNQSYTGGPYEPNTANANKKTTRSQQDFLRSTCVDAGSGRQGSTHGAADEQYR
jgi:hypothetical protein